MTLSTSDLRPSSNVSLRRTVSIVIPQYNRLELTSRAVTSLQRWHSANVEVVIVDDASPDGGVVESARSLLGNVTLVRAKRRSGVTAAWNLGAKAASGEILIFLNNDTVTLREWISALCAPLDDEGCLLTGCGWRSEREWPDGDRRFLPGWCLAIERASFFALGQFDERFRMYFSDTDLQVRVRQHSLNGLAAVNSLPLRHVGHASTSGLVTRREEWRRDRLLFRRKWALKERS